MTNKRDNEKKQKDMQELYMELNSMNQQMTDLQKQIQELENTVLEIDESKKCLSEIGKAKQGKEILVPIVSGIFAKTKLSNNDEVIVNVGANIAVTKTISEANKLLNEQLQNVKNTQKTFVDKLTDLTTKAQEIESGLRGMLKE